MENQHPTGSCSSEPKSPFQKLFASSLHDSPQLLRNTATYENSSTPAPPSSPLTIFYNGMVSVFDVPRHKAEIIIKAAAEKKIMETTTSQASDFSLITAGEPTPAVLLGQLNGDFPMARKRSLQRFMKKRKER